MSNKVAVIDGKAEIVKGNLPELFKEVNLLHAESCGAASTVRDNAIRIGVALHQIKATVGHGGFQAAMEKHCPKIGLTTCSKYMRVVEELAQEQIFTSGEDLKKLPPSERKSEARKAAADLNWLELPFKAEALNERTKGRQLNELYLEYGVVKPKKDAGGFRPPPDDVHTWLEKHHPKLLGTTFDELPEKLQKAFKKQYRPKAPPPEMIVEGIRAKARGMFDMIADAKHEKDCKHYEPEFVANLKRLMKDFVADLEKLEKKTAEKEEK